MLRCFLECSTTTDKAAKTFERRSHWHCCLCTQLFDRIGDFQMHLANHEKNNKPSNQRQKPAATDSAISVDVVPEAGEEESKGTCAECGKGYQNERALQRHVREVHRKKREGAITASKYLTGVCVDFRKGIFMVRRSFSGVARPIHCQHSTYPEPSISGVTACELNECRGAAIVARLSGHPAFECVHLQSVQYALPYQQPISLKETSLNDVTGQKLAWFKQSRKKECLSLKQRAEQGGHPLIVQFPREASNTTSERFWYFSVFDGGVHYWSRFHRVIVGYDQHQNRWMCACSPAKRPCVHKSVAKWFIYQIEPSLLSDVHEQDFDDGSPSDEDSEEVPDDKSDSTKTSHYPPTGLILDEMIRHQRVAKRVPPFVTPGNLTDDDPMPTHLIPVEEVCHICKTTLGDPREVSKRAMIVGLTKVYSGTLLFFSLICNY